MRQAEENPPTDADIEIVHATAARARVLVREHPFASLSVAALVGMWLVRRKPWRSLGGSLVAGLLARQAIALALSPGSALRSRLTAGGTAKQEVASKP